MAQKKQNPTTAPNAVARSDVLAPALPAPRTLPLDGFSVWRDLRIFIPLSRESIRLREIEGHFPKRVALGSQRTIAWPNREIHRWLADPANYRSEG